MPKYLKAVAMTTEKPTANMNVVDFTKIHKLSLFFYKIRETICETLLWEIAA